MIDCQLNEYQENYDYLLEVGYLEHKSGNLEVRVTRLGQEALESYQNQQNLYLLQEQNTKIQLSLKRIQWTLVILTIFEVLLKIICPKLS